MKYHSYAFEVSEEGYKALLKEVMHDDLLLFLK